MDFDKKTISAVLLIGLILILVQTDFYQKNFMPAPPEATTVIDEQGAIEKTVRPLPAETKETLVAPTLKKEVFETPVISKEGVIAAKGAGEDVMIETALYKAVFSTGGATLRSFRLKEYKGTQGEIVEIIGQDGPGNLSLRFPSKGDTTDTGLFIFDVDKRAITLDEGKNQASIEFTLDLNGNSQVRKTFTFYNDRYAFDLRVELLNMNRVVDGFSYFLSWRSGMASTEPDFNLDMEMAKCFTYQGDVEDFGISDEADAETFVGQTDWIALRNKYFAAAVIPRSDKGQSAIFAGTAVDVGESVPFKKYSFDLQMPFTQKDKRVDEFTLYLGPLDYDIVTSFDVGLEEMMDLGYAIFRPFGKFILWSFTLLHEIIPNYGFVIIVFSILVKILLFPLTRKSYQSMKEMELLKPMMEGLNEKYKDDAQKKQQEVMKLYKEYGINPLGGCIPMVLQMPLLIALFSIFNSTIELRGAEFIWWITDLARPDTVAMLPFTVPFYGNKVNILPLFMGITMFIQQKMTMKDPKQKAMVYFMPVFLTLLFNSFPAGLNLYYALFNLFSIIQEKFIPYKIRSIEEMRATKAKKKTKPRAKYDYKKRK